MATPLSNKIIREITPLSDKDCFYIAERYKTEFTYPIHNHSEFELNFTEKAAGVRRIVGDSSEVIGDYDLVLITGKDLEHVWEQNECRSKEIREITIQFSSDLFFLFCHLSLRLSGRKEEHAPEHDNHHYHVNFRVLTLIQCGERHRLICSERISIVICYIS